MTDFLRDAAVARPDAPATDDGVRRWSLRELRERAARHAAVLVEAGAAPGRTVALICDPSPEALAALHGAFRTGALVAPLHPALTPAERAPALEALAPAVVVGDDGLTLAELADRADGALPAGPPPERPPDAPVAVLWTSGTSGRRRGVLLSERGLRASAEGTRLRLGLGPDDVWYASLSPAHVGGLALVTRAALLGSCLMVRGRFSVGELDALLDEGGLTHASLVPTMLLRLLERREGRPAPPGLRCLLVGGAAAPPPLVERAVAAGYPVALTYGLTEATSQVATAPPDEVRRRPDAVGRPLPGVEVRIAPSGEIEVRGPTVSPGLVDGTPVADAGGWLATGDLGRLDASGVLRVTGRRSDRIVSGGVTVDAHEVEAVVRAHPRVADVCVVGLPDEVWGERVAAAVVPTHPDDAEVQGLSGWLETRLSAALRPRTLRWVPELPLNANGKVDRGAVRRLLAGE